MITTLVIGAHGRTGALIVNALLASGHDVLGTVRQREHLSALSEVGAIAKLVDLATATVGDLQGAMNGVDAVVYAAGSSSGASRDAVTEVDGQAIIRAADAAVSAGVRQFVLISAHRVDEDFGDEHVMHLLRAKRAADAHLRATPLEWTIIRPDALTSGPSTGRVTARPRVPNGAISRVDLATVVQIALDHGLARRQQFELTSGDTSIVVALQSLSAPE